MREVELKNSVLPSALLKNVNNTVNQGMSRFHIYPNECLENCGTSTYSVSFY